MSGACDSVKFRNFRVLIVLLERERPKNKALVLDTIGNQRSE